MYRPKDWEPIDQPFYIIDYIWGQYISAKSANSLYEAGADAILKALKAKSEEPLYVTYIGEKVETLTSHTIYSHGGEDGFAVFIPDEE